MKFIALLLLISNQIFANNLNINHSHLNEIVGDNDASFEPVEIVEKRLTETEREEGIRKRFRITYSRLSQSDMDTTFTIRKDGDLFYDNNSEEFNKMLEENLELKEGHKFSIEYLVTQNFSIELADTYRRYQMDGRRVGFTEGNLFEPERTDIYEADNVTILNDIQIGAKYAIRIIDRPNFRLDLSPGASVGLVHVQSDSNAYYNGEKYDESHYNDIGGYSYGVSIEAKAVLWDRFFVSVGAEQRNYVIAPMEHESGFSQQIDQSGVNVFIGIGFFF